MIAPEVTTAEYRSPSQHLAWRLRLLSTFLISGLVACGGGGGGGSQPPPVPDFSLALSPTSQTVDGGSSASVSLSATAINGFSSQVSVQVGGLPAGVSVSPSSITLTPGTAQQATLSVAANAATTSQTVIFTGVSGSLKHTAQFSLSVAGKFSGLPSRTRYVRTDATTEYFQWANQHWIVYDATTARYFITDPSSNQVIVVDGVSQHKLGTIGIPGAFGIDETPDHSTLYIGTLIGDVYTVDPVAMLVTKRYPESEIGPSGFSSAFALVLSDGRLALAPYFNGIDYVGREGIAIWNPVSNAITIYGGTQGQPSVCGDDATDFVLNADRTQIVFESGQLLCEVNASTGTILTATSPGVEPSNIAITPDGKYVVLAGYGLTANPNTAVVFDAQTLALVEEFNVLGDAASASGFFVSADSMTLFIPGDPATGLIYAYDLATQQMVGWVPNIFIEPISGGGALGPIDSPYLLANDGTGLFAGPLEEGIGFVDVSVLQSGPLGTQFNNSYTPPMNPATGPATGGTATEWSDLAPVSPQSVYFGAKQATAVSTSQGEAAAFVDIQATTPSGQAGPVDVYLFTTDGGIQLLPEAFSYGPTILEVTPNLATAEGGGTGYIYGYGFGPATSNSIPSDLTVTVNGLAAPVTAFVGNAYGAAYPPFPLESIAYTIPPGTAGSSVSVSVTASAAAATAANALSYLPATQQFPLKGAALAQGIYDSYTDLYYFTDATQLQVFSRTQEKWLAPIPIAPPAGAAERLWGLALSPNGTMMAIADVGSGVIYLLNPATPATVETFPTSSIYGQTLPSGVAVSDSGIVYYTTAGQGSGYLNNFFKLDTNTSKITDYGIEGPEILGEALLRIAISADNSKVFFNDQGYVFSINTATDKMLPAAVNGECCYGNYELALSSNQTQFTANDYIYDFDLNGESYYALNDREILNILYVYGAKFSPDGRLLFQPSANGIDVFANGTGNLQTRVSLPDSLSPNYDALVADGIDNSLIAITGTGDGIAAIDLTSLVEPQPLPSRRIADFRVYPLENHSDDRINGPKSARRPIQHSLAIKHLTRPLPFIKLAP
jgi:hypothetical protein